MATLLDDALVTETLTALPGWSGDTTRIWREIALSPGLDTELRRQVEVDSGAMGHRPVVEDMTGGTRFVLRTEESGGVTELDIALASHISDLLHRIDRAQAGIKAERKDDVVVVFRAGEGAGGDDPEPHDDGTFTHEQTATGGSTPTLLSAVDEDGETP